MSNKPDDWPEVVFVGDSVASLGLTRDQVAMLAGSIVCSLLGESLPIVSRIILADMSTYGDTLRAELGRGEGPTHTDRPDYQGVAMTIPTIHDDGSVENTIVACAGVVAAALGIKCDIEPIMPEGMGRYLLGHELAHCVDHRLRPPTDRPSLTDQAGFSIARTCAYYRRILLEELAACRLAGSLLDDETFDLLMSLDADPLEREIGLLQDSRMQFQTRQSRDLYTLAHNSAGCWWLVLIQFAKVFGHMVGAGR